MSIFGIISVTYWLIIFISTYTILRLIYEDKTYKWLVFIKDDLTDSYFSPIGAILKILLVTGMAYVILCMVGLGILVIIEEF